MQAFDRDMMAKALALAARGEFTASPNPCVGCVISDGKTIAEGWHQWAGSAHAEIHALADARKKQLNLAESTLYVTLEPCSHQGRTPPCSDAVIQSGIRRVVYGMKDPNPQVSGSGLAKLVAAGITVEGPLLEEEALALNRGFIRRMVTGLPFLFAKVAQSLDGRTAMANGESQWITGPEARADVQRLRASSCAVVTGIETVLADNPKMTVRDSRFAVDGKTRQPLRVILDSRLRIPPDAHILATPEECLVVFVEGDAEKQAHLTAMGVETLQIQGRSGRIDLILLMKLLGERNLNRVMIEAGATLLGAFLQANLLDEVISYVAPTFLGSEARPLANLPLQQLQDRILFTTTQVRQIGDDLRLTLAPKS